MVKNLFAVIFGFFLNQPTSAQSTLNLQKAAIAANTYQLLMQFNNVRMGEVNLQIVTDCYHNTISKVDAAHSLPVPKENGIQLLEDTVVVLNACIEASNEEEPTEEGSSILMGYTLQRANTFFENDMVGVGIRAPDGKTVNLVSSVETLDENSTAGLMVPSQLDPQCLNDKDLKKISLTTASNQVIIQQVGEVAPEKHNVARVYGFWSERCSFVGVELMPVNK
jgi:hypothetical protein